MRVSKMIFIPNFINLACVTRLKCQICFDSFVNNSAIIHTRIPWGCGSGSTWLQLYWGLWGGLLWGLLYLLLILLLLKVVTHLGSIGSVSYWTISGIRIRILWTWSSWKWNWITAEKILVHFVIQCCYRTLLLGKLEAYGVNTCHWEDISFSRWRVLSQYVSLGGL